MSDDEENFDMFKEPAGYFEEEKQPTFVQHQLADGTELNLRLVGHNPLWGHHLWNAGRTIADYLESRADSLIKGKSVLEFGAGAGLPSLLCGLKGASTTVVTDYPDAELVENLQYNVDHYDGLGKPPKVSVEGYLWGAPIDRLVQHVPDDSGFDVLILADLLFNHSEHAKLLESVKKTLKRTSEAKALVFFTPYRPWLLQKDLAFFDLARDGGFTVTQILEKVMDRVMFENDPGDELLRRTVFGYEMHWAQV